MQLDGMECSAGSAVKCIQCELKEKKFQVVLFSDN